MNKQITIRALKYGNHPHYEWSTTLLEQTDTYIVVLGEPGRKLHHFTKGKIFTVDHWTLEFFSTDSWFTVSADVIGGRIQQYYCNINEPAQINGNLVSFVDLDLDFIQRNGEWKVVDEEEFESNSITFGYPDVLVQRARQELEKLQLRVARNQFPFDGTLASYLHRIPKDSLQRWDHTPHG